MGLKDAQNDLNGRKTWLEGAANKGDTKSYENEV